MPAPTTHRATQENGPSIVAGRLVWTSATGITTADPQSYGGCTRKWYYDQVMDLKAPATKAMQGGTVLHSEIEDRLLTGASLKSTLALAGGHFIPHPGDNLLVEKPIHFTTPLGVDIYGHVDLYNLRQQYIDPNGELKQDPPWSMEVKDWKTTSDFAYSKSERELSENIQLNTYAEAGFRMWPDLEHARLTHVYFRTKGSPASKLVTVRRSRDEVAMRWGYAESVIRVMAQAAREPTADTVPENIKSCDAYRGCPHAKYCSAFGRTSLDALYNKVAQDFVHAPTTTLERQEPREDAGIQPAVPRTESREDHGFGEAPHDSLQVRAVPGAVHLPLLAAAESMRDMSTSVLGRAAASHGPQPRDGRGTPFVVQPVQRVVGSVVGRSANTSSGRGVCEGTQQGVNEMGILANNPQIMTQPQQPQPDMRQQLAAEEQAMRQQVTQQQMLPQNQTQAIAAACQRIMAHGRGFPTVAGNASQPYAATLNLNQPVPPGFVFQGQGQLASVTLVEPHHFDQLAGELDQQRAQQAPVAPPPPAPAPTVSFLPPNAPQSMPQLASAPVAQPQAPAPIAPPAAAAPAPEAAAPRRGRGRPKAQDTAPEAVAAPAAQMPPPTTPSSAPAPQAPPVAASTSDAPVETEAGWGSILINARFATKQTKSLAGYVDYINSELAKRYSVNADGTPGIQDVRCAPKDSILGFGGWKGAVREVVKADPPPQGDYHLDTQMDELNEAVADALRVVAGQKGWIYVRGVR